MLALVSSLSFRLKNPGYLSKHGTSDGEGGLAEKLTREFKTLPLEKMTTLDQMCFTCMRYKTVHAEHCKICNQCVEGYHLHDSKCVGEGNQRFYGIYILTLWLLLAGYLIQLVCLSTNLGGMA